jgi:uncharacterized protein YdeI (YjbR/CyaY-like superfamily)
MKKYKNFDEYIIGQSQWKPTLILLRKILLSTGLEETIKWGFPVYTYQGKNLVGISSFKSYAGLWFFQGALLTDKTKKLINAQEGITKALRQWRFESLQEVEKESNLIIAYVKESIQNQIQGKEIRAVRQKKSVNSSELNRYLNANPTLKRRFNTFSEAKQREFAEYIYEAKKPETKQKRLGKIGPMILQGQGLNDKYIA